MKPKYTILNYSTNTIIRNLSTEEVCAICKALMIMPNPSFDIVEAQKFVTADFIEKNGAWQYEPIARVSPP